MKRRILALLVAALNAGSGVRSILKIRTKRRPPVYSLPHFAGEPVRGGGESFDSSNTPREALWSPADWRLLLGNGSHMTVCKICRSAYALCTLHSVRYTPCFRKSGFRVYH